MMKRIFAFMLLLAATAALDSCVVDNGGNHNLNAYQLRGHAGYLVEYSTLVSVTSINQMILDGRDVNAEGFTGKAAEDLLFTRTEQDRWEVVGQNNLVNFTLTLLREPAADGYDKWICRDLQCLHDEGDDGFIRLASEGDIVFEWVTRVYTISMNASLEQTGTYRAEFFPNPRAAACADWCVLTYTAGNLEWSTNRGSGTNQVYY